jgi:membrane peptidoglycan carboxypeptidase
LEAWSCEVRGLGRAGLRAVRWQWGPTLVVILLGVAAQHEIRTSAVQARIFSRYARRAYFTIEPGPSVSIAFPKGGPFDERMGYSRIPDFQGRLGASGYQVAEQARFSPELARLVRWGMSPPYREPAVAGLTIHGLGGIPLSDDPSRIRTFERFEDIPPVVVKTLLFLENRQLGEPADPRGNPVVEWGRLAKAGASYAANKVGLPVHMEGGSTLATQLEKYRHSPQGRTQSSLEKIGQMTAASLKVYRDGPDTRAKRREIILDYLNTVPLGSAPGYGEVHGIGEGLFAWFDLDLSDVRRDLSIPEMSAAKVRAYKHALALLCAVRAPTLYLVRDRPALEARMDYYAGRLRASGVIDADFLAALRRTPVNFLRRAEATLRAPFSQRKAANAVRAELMHLLGLSGLYELDRLDLKVETTIDVGLQNDVNQLFHQLKEPAFPTAHGLREDRLLSQGNPSNVVYSFLLYERTPLGNALRVQTDSLDQPLDLNQGMKLELGSTAKLRTTAHYLEVVALLHEELTGLDSSALAAQAHAARDPITRWAVNVLRLDRKMALETFLDRGLDRTYSANPHEVFFTGGGVHRFRNFDPQDDERILSVREALVRSTNLVFIRLMRDLVRYHESRLPYDTQAVLTEPSHPQRRTLLLDIANAEAAETLTRAYHDYRNLPREMIISRLLGTRGLTPRRVATIFYAWNPGADESTLSHWLETWSGGVAPEEVKRLARTYGNPRLSLADFAYLLKRDPLEVWCAGQLARDPELTLLELVLRSGKSREVASSWLFQPHNRRAQDLRLRARVEQDAFDRMTPYWQRLGFPFRRLVPSYATAIGSSSDRPNSLAELMGIIINDGVHLPTFDMEKLLFGEGTPYHTILVPSPQTGNRLMRVPVARALRDVLVDVVKTGTAHRVSGAFVRGDGTPARVGGKTGSGDNRFETFGHDGRVRSSRAVNRTATFVFFIDDRYFGVISAFVPGREAEHYRFTSALPVALLKLAAHAINGRLSNSTSTPAIREEVRGRDLSSEVVRRSVGCPDSSTPPV